MENNQNQGFKSRRHHHEKEVVIWQPLFDFNRLQNKQDLEGLPLIFGINLPVLVHPKRYTNGSCWLRQWKLPNPQMISVESIPTTSLSLKHD